MAQVLTSDRIAHLDGIDLHYEVHGSGEPLFLLHGMTGCARDWRHAALDRFAGAYQVIAVDARGHGGSTNPQPEITHRQCARDLIALLDHLGVGACKAIGMSLGGNTLLHVASMQPERVEAMVVVSATMYFPEQARAVMAAIPDEPPAEELRRLRESHTRGDEQIAALWKAQRDLKDSYEDVNFTPPTLARIAARTLIVYGDRDPLYPVSMAFEMHRCIRGSELWVVPGGGHGPIYLDAADTFAAVSLRFLSRSSA